MFQQNPTLTEFVAKLLDACRPLQRGDYLRHEAIIPILRVQPNEGHWPTCIVKLKRQLELTRGITIRCERGVGYRLLTIDEQLTEAPRARLRSSNRQLTKGRGHVACLPSRGLSEHQRHIKVAMLESIQKARTAVTSQVRRNAALCRPYQNMPRMQPNAGAAL
jgi:hypothetical protein